MQPVVIDSNLGNYVTALKKLLKMKHENSSLRIDSPNLPEILHPLVCGCDST